MDKEKLQELLNKLQEEGGLENLQMSDYKLLVELMGMSLDEATQQAGIEDMQEFNDMKSKAENLIGRISLDKRQELTEELQKTVLNDNVRAGLSALGNILDVGEASRQIKESDEALAEISDPSGIKPFRRSKSLSEAIQRAERAISAPSLDVATRPFTTQVEDTYNKDINQARVASGGQAGAMGSYTQAASNRRNRAIQNIPALREGILAQRNATLGGLLQTEQRESFADALNEARRANLDYQRFSDENRAAGSLGQAGRINLRGSLRNILNNAAGAFTNYQRGQTLNDKLNTIYSKRSGMNSVRRPIEIPLPDLSPDINDANSMMQYSDIVKQDLTGRRVNPITMDIKGRTYQPWRQNLNKFTNLNAIPEFEGATSARTGNKTEMSPINLYWPRGKRY